MNLLPYKESLHRAHYERLNREWIERDFEIEPHDLAIFASPDRYIVRPGGFIFMAEHESQLVGTCSAIQLEKGVYELAKLAVTPSAQGLGLGRTLCERIIEEARSRGAGELVITTNSKLEAAVALYRKLGFIDAAGSRHDHYKRCDMTMVLTL